MYVLSRSKAKQQPQKTLYKINRKALPCSTCVPTTWKTKYINLEETRRPPFSSSLYKDHILYIS